jgi:hypothetical protein
MREKLNLYANVLNLFACKLESFKLKMTVLDVNFLSLLEKNDEWTEFFQINMNILKTCIGIYRTLVKFHEPFN